MQWAFRPPWGRPEGCQGINAQKASHLPAFILFSFVPKPCYTRSVVHCSCSLGRFLVLPHSYRWGLQEVDEQCGAVGVRWGVQAVCRGLAVPTVSRLVWGRADLPVLPRCWEPCWNEKGLQELLLRHWGLPEGGCDHQLQHAALL